MHLMACSRTWRNATLRDEHRTPRMVFTVEQHVSFVRILTHWSRGIPSPRNGSKEAWFSSEELRGAPE
jgi:hypothetical protein